MPEYGTDIDHAGLISRPRRESFKRGEAIYDRVCANCHGTKDQPGSLPTSLRFAAGKFKNGGDPYSMYQTLTHGFGHDDAADLDGAAAEVRRDPLPPRGLPEAAQPGQYAKVDDAYLARLPKGKSRGPEPVEHRAVGDAWTTARA